MRAGAAPPVRAWCVVRGAWCVVRVGARCARSSRLGTTIAMSYDVGVVVPRRRGVVRRRAAEWHDDEVDHPGRSDSRRAESAVTTTVVEGGATVDAAAAGARIGGPVGAALFPGVGMVVGGIVGSAIGVRLGGTGGEVLGDELKDVDEGRTSRRACTTCGRGSSDDLGDDRGSGGSGWVWQCCRWGSRRASSERRSSGSPSSSRSAPPSPVGSACGSCCPAFRGGSDLAGTAESVDGERPTEVGPLNLPLLPGSTAIEPARTSVSGGSRAPSRG